MKISKHKGSGRWVVRIPAKLSSSGKRDSKYFPTKETALEFLSAFNSERREHGRSAVTSEERAWINIARAKLGNINKLLDVLEHWKRTGANVKAIGADEAVEKFITYRSADRLNTGTRHDITWRLRTFAKAFGSARLDQITASEIDEFLRTRNEGWDRRSFWKRIRPLFKHAAMQGWIVQNPLDRLDAPKTPEAKRGIYTPEEYHKLLQAAQSNDEYVLRYLVLSGMAFFRTQELVRRFNNEPVLEWSDICLDRKEIHVRPQVAKSIKRAKGDERFVQINPSLFRWLSGLWVAEGEDRVIPFSVRHFRGRLNRICQLAGVQLIDNGLRHSAISYYLAMYPDVGVQRVAKWSGNSEATTRKHYLRILRKEQGEDWFNVVDQLK
jgi:integrase